MGLGFGVCKWGECIVTVEFWFGRKVGEFVWVVGLGDFGHGGFNVTFKLNVGDCEGCAVQTFDETYCAELQEC